jgi:DnaJ homolog subfamily C member 17
MALDAKLRIKEARKQRYANFDKKRKAMLEELEEAERTDKEAKSAEATKKQKYAQEAEQIRGAGRRMVEERQAELRRQQEEAERVERSAQEELEPPQLGACLSPSSTFARELTFLHMRARTFPGEHDTTVRLKYPLAKYPHLTTTDALHTFMSSTFGPVDKDSLVLSMKPPKKAPHKPPKYATAAVPFKTIADAHAAVCASRRSDRGLDEFEIGWMGGCEPAVWSWAERMLKSNEKDDASASATPMPGLGGARDAGGVAAAASPAGVRVQDYSGVPSNPVAGSQFASFPSSLVRTHVPCPLLASSTDLTFFTVSSPLRSASSLRSWPGF